MLWYGGEAWNPEGNDYLQCKKITETATNQKSDYSISAIRLIIADVWLAVMGYCTSLLCRLSEGWTYQSISAKNYLCCPTVFNHKGLLTVLLWVWNKYCLCYSQLTIRSVWFWKWHGQLVYTCNTDISTEQALERYSKVEHQGRERETGTQKADDGHTHSLTSVFLAQYSNSIDECKQKRFFVLCNSIAYKDNPL